MLLKVQVIVATGHGDVLVANAETDVQYLLRSDYVSGNWKPFILWKQREKSPGLI